MLRKLPRILLYLLFFMGTAGVSAYLVLHLMIKSADTVVVPRLEGRDVVYVLETLSAMGLNTKVSGREYDPKVPENCVIFQDPEAGSEIKKDRDVRIVLSAGPETVAMPGLSGMDLRRAQIALEQNGLLTGWISRTFDDQPKDSVLAQFPAPGQAVRRQTEAGLLVSMGKMPQALMMPDLTGLRPDDAILLAERWGLSVGKVVPTSKVDAPPDVVIDQFPAMGYRVIQGDAIDITVNRPRGGVDSTKPEPGNSPFFVVYKTPMGFLRSHIQLKVNLGRRLETLFDRYVEPGETLWLLLPERGAEFFLYRDGGPVDLDQQHVLTRRLEQ